METIHGQLKKAGVPLERHGYNLHAMVTPQSRTIIEQNGLAARVNIFYSKDDHQPWFNIPSAFSPSEVEDNELDTSNEPEKSQPDFDMKKALEDEMHKAAQEIIEEQKKALRRVLEERKAVIRQIIEEERRIVLARTEALGQSIVKIDLKFWDADSNQCQPNDQPGISIAK